MPFILPNCHKTALRLMRAVAFEITRFLFSINSQFKSVYEFGIGIFGNDLLKK